ncbi:MAG TPA: hypothetical protein VES67_04825 [Vicinamibacterales bacterium]|nr:hypothetical protein [Vicinamibacterales bacterium]
MSRHINVNPDHYKVAGRERQGEAINQELQRQQFTEQQAANARWQAKQDNQTPWENPAAPSAEPETPKRSRRPKRTGGRPSKRRPAPRTSKRAATPRRRRAVAKRTTKTKRPQSRRRKTAPPTKKRR